MPVRRVVYGEKNNRKTRLALMRRERWSRLAVRPMVGTCLVLGLVTFVTVPVAADPPPPDVTAAVTAQASVRVSVAPVPHLPGGSRVVGPATATAQETGAVALTLPDGTAVTQFIEETSDPTSPEYQHYLGAGQFASVFGPSQAEITAVEQQLTADGLQVTGVSSNDLLVEFAGTAADVETAFDTGLNQVQLADGTLGQATTAAVSIPSSIAPDVQAVVGLDQLVPETNDVMKPTAGHDGRHAGGRHPSHLQRRSRGLQSTRSPNRPTVPSPTSRSPTSYGLEPLYNAGDLGSGQTIDVYELEPFAMSDVATFDECYFGTDNTGNITVTNVDGGPGTGYGSGEAALDIEDVSALAPGAKIDVFQGPNMNNNWGPLDTWNQIAIADNARQVTSSWGVCEPALQQGAPGVEQVENEIFEQMAAQGQSVFDAAGDDGSDSCAAPRRPARWHPYFPSQTRLTSLMSYPSGARRSSMPPILRSRRSGTTAMTAGPVVAASRRAGRNRRGRAPWPCRKPQLPKCAATTPPVRPTTITWPGSTRP